MMNLKVSRPFNLIFNLQLSRVMSERIVVDPLTRIEGHLRIEADIENGKIKDAYSSGTMVRRTRMWSMYLHPFALLCTSGRERVRYRHPA